MALRESLHYDILKRQRSEKIRGISADIKDVEKTRRSSEVYPISREQFRRCSLQSSLLSLNQLNEITFPSGISVPNSVVRKSIEKAEESLQNGIKARRLSSKELEEKILKRLATEHIRVNLHDGISSESIANAHSGLYRELNVEGKKKHMKRKKPVDKEKELNRILRRTSIITPFEEGKSLQTETIRQAIEKSEKKHNILVQPEEVDITNQTNLNNNPPVELTPSWIRKISEDIITSAKKISKVTEKMEKNKEKIKIQRKADENVESYSPKTQKLPKSPSKKEKYSMRKKSSQKLSRIGSSSYDHPTIHEVDEEINFKRSESRQTQLSQSSLWSGRSTAKSFISLQQKSSLGNPSSKLVRSINVKPARSQSLKKITSGSKDRSSKQNISTVSLHKGSIEIKKNKSSLSQRSSSQKSVLSDKSISGKQRRSTTKVSSKKKLEGLISRSSSRTKSSSSDEHSVSDVESVSSIEERTERKSLSSLIELYYASPNRRSTSESLDKYMKNMLETFKKPSSKENKCNTIFESKNEDSAYSFETDINVSDTEGSFVIKRDEDSTNEEESSFNIEQDIKTPEICNEITKKDNLDLDKWVKNSSKLRRISSIKLKKEPGFNKDQENNKIKRNSKVLSKSENGKMKPLQKSVDKNTVLKQNPSGSSTNKTKLPDLSKTNQNKVKYYHTVNKPVTMKRSIMESDSEILKYLANKKIITLKP